MARSRRADRAKMPVRCYRYGLPTQLPKWRRRKPGDGGDPLAVVMAQMRLGNRYRNRLVEIERARRDAYHSTLARHDPDVEAAWKDVRDLEDALETLRADLQEQRTGIRRRQQRVEGKVEVEALREELGRAYRRLSEREKSARHKPEVRQALDEIEGTAKADAKAAYREFSGEGLYWGTRGAWDRVARDQFRSGPLPRFRRFGGEGLIAVQLQTEGDRNGYSVADLTGEGEHASAARRIVKLDLDPQPRRQGRRYGVVRVRIGSQGTGRDPVWGAFPIVYHRPIPPEARIKWVRVLARRVAAHQRWHVVFEVELPEGWVPEYPGQGTVALDVGWRRVESGGEVSLLTGRWRGSDGHSGTVTLPPAIVGQWAKAAELRAVRDRLFNNALMGLAGAVKAVRATLPVDHREAVRNLERWRSAGRLVRLAQWWSEHRLGEDDPIYHALARWYEDDTTGRKKDKHLWEWEANARRRAVAQRTHVYRNVSAMLARRYGRLLVEDLDLSALAARPVPESDRYEERSDVAHSQRTVAAAGELREACVGAMLARGGSVGIVGAGLGPEGMLKASESAVDWHARTRRSRKGRKAKGNAQQEGGAARGDIRRSRQRGSKPGKRSQGGRERKRRR